MIVPNLVQISPRGLLGEWVKYNVILFIYLFIYIFFMNSFTGQTRRRVFTLKNPNFGGVNRRFKAKGAKY